MKSIGSRSSNGPFASLIAVLLLLQFIMVLVPVSALEPKMDIHIEKLHASFLGEKDADMAGYSVAVAGDVNGDGYDDILIGAPQNGENGDQAGQVYLIFGKASGWTTDLDLGKADASWWGEAKNDYAGLSVAGAGDVNGDGYGDILIGAPGSDDSTPDGGQVYLIFGKTDGWQMDVDLGKSDASFVGASNGENLGHSVAGAGDVNGDGFDDILMGAFLADDMGVDSGMSYLFLGMANGWNMDVKDGNADASFFGAVPGDYSGWSVAGVRDVNKDGYDDFIIGAFYNDDNGPDTGTAYLFFGKVSGWATYTNIKSADVRFFGEGIKDWAGYAVSGAWDVNGDGYSDILINSPRNNCDGTRAFCGQTYLVLGKGGAWVTPQILNTASASFWGEHVSDYAGKALSSAGDVNRDGYDDFLIGDYQNSDSGANAGQAYLILGKPTGWAMDSDLGLVSYASFQGEGDTAAAGVSVSGGDVNGDGYSDVLIGSEFKTGKTYLMLTFSAPPTATGLTALNDQVGSTITLTWNAPDFWNEPITGYRIYRSMDGTNYKNIANIGTAKLVYDDQDVVKGRTYYYAVVTVDGTGALSDMSKGVSLTCDKDTDLDGLGDGVDPDDDGDGVPDYSDAFPLDPAETLDTDLDGKGNNADTDDDNDGIIDTLDAEPLNPLNGLTGDVHYLNTTLKKVNTNLSKMRTDLASVDGNLTAMSQDLNTMDTTLTGLLTSVQTQMTALSSNFDGLNASMRAQLDDLQFQLMEVNTSLHTSITGVSTELHAFKTETATSLQQIKDML